MTAIDLRRVLAAERQLDRDIETHGPPDPQRTADWLAKGAPTVDYKPIRIPVPLLDRVDALSTDIRTLTQRDGIPSTSQAQQVRYVLQLGLQALDSSEAENSTPHDEAEPDKVRAYWRPTRSSQIVIP